MNGCLHEVGMCECGCGQATKPAPNTSTRNGWVKGRPLRFVNGHAARVRVRVDPSRYRWSMSGAHRDREHRVIAERAMGRPLPNNAEVHHVNGIKSDNRNCNLVVCPDREYHMLLHKRTRALDACGNASFLQCAYCKQWAPNDQLRTYTCNTTKSGKRTFHHHRECHNEYRRQRVA